MARDALLPPGASGPGRIASFQGAGGRELRYRVIEADAPRHHLLYCHGIESHGTWFLPAAERLRERGCTTWLVDRRGSGLNRDDGPGDCPSHRVLLDDLAAFRSQVADVPIQLVGLSWGGKLATAAAIDRPEGVAGLTLITPGLKALVDLPLLHKLRLIASLPFGGRARLPIPIEAEMFTRTERFLEFIRNDDWRLHRATARFFLAGIELDRMIARGLPDLDVPTVLFLAGGERIIDNAGVTQLLESLPHGRLQTIRYDDATHSIQFDQVDRLVDDLVPFFDGAAAS